MTFSLLSLPQPLRGPTDYEHHVPARLRHPVYGWLGLRPVLAQHTAAEHDAIGRWASGCSTPVEIGVAEGVSALAIRATMSENGTLHLIDPFHLSRIAALNFTKRVAHRIVASSARGKVTWVEKFSLDAAQNWTVPIDFLLIDGDHSEKGVRLDWEAWSRFIVPGGVVLFHDARLFEGGWTHASYGPVVIVNELFRSGPIPGWKVAEEIHSLVVVQRTGNQHLPNSTSASKV